MVGPTVEPMVGVDGGPAIGPIIGFVGPVSGSVIGHVVPVIRLLGSVSGPLGPISEQVGPISLVDDIRRRGLGFRRGSEDFEHLLPSFSLVRMGVGGGSVSVNMCR